MKSPTSLAETGLPSEAAAGSRLRVFWRRHARLWMSLVLLSADLLSLLAAGLAAVGLRYLLGAPLGLLVDLLEPGSYWSLAPLLLAFAGVFALRGLYPAVGLGPVEELRRLSTSTSLVMLLATGLTFWLRSAELYSRLVLIFTWLFALIFVPLGRWLARQLARRLEAWGEPVVILGYGPQTLQALNFMETHKNFDLRPVALVSGREGPVQNEYGLPVYSTLPHPDGSLAGVQTAIVIPAEMPAGLRLELAQAQNNRFRRLVLISDLSWIGSLGVTPYDFEGIVGLEIHQNLLNPWQRSLKGALDVIFGLGLGLLALPLFALAAVAIVLDSPGGVFYRQRRIGKDGKALNVLKFRTMHPQAEARLAAYLEAHPEQRPEWELTHKLAVDPRVTRAGKFLRRTSLDELPQLWNVLKGEMSLVGPRPFLPNEIEHYQKGLALYQRVRPGITGLWQVSGRARLSFAERVRYDEYYVRNWSIWLDLYILLRTAWVVLRGEGAY